MCEGGGYDEEQLRIGGLVNEPSRRRVNDIPWYLKLTVARDNKTLRKYWFNAY
jgi:hypothetical protein